MGWRDLLETKEETNVLPWVGGRTLTLNSGRTWSLKGMLPREHGWYRFRFEKRNAWVVEPAERDESVLVDLQKGYLIGDLFVPTGASVARDLNNLTKAGEKCHLIEPGIDRFSLVSAGKLISGDFPLIFNQEEFPMGPEDDVRRAFEDKLANVHHISGVQPALDAAFRIETWQREEAERRRLELERLRREEEERLAREARRQALVERLGDGAARREMAQLDFGEAARAALTVGGAEYLDHRPARRRNEMVVRFRMLNQRFECTCDARSMSIIDAGICLTDHHTGESGDSYFTLESLPAVIQEAHRDGLLVVMRHVD